MFTLKKKQYENSKLKRQLIIKKECGVKELHWRLTRQQMEYVEQLGYRIEPFLYCVRTKKFYNLKDLHPLLKSIHYKNKKGKDSVVIRLKSSEMKLLDEYGLSYYPYKYIIYL